MEIFELRYFLSVARFQNIHRASEYSNVSPAALSKAISRLEDELSVKLFSRKGRNIHLTEHGKALQKRASGIVKLEEDARLEVGGQQGRIQIVIAAPEVLLSKFGIPLSLEIKNRLPQAVFEYLAADDEAVMDAVDTGDAHLGITTTELSRHQGLAGKVLGESKFHTFVGKAHPLHAKAKAKKVVPVEEVLKYPFVSPTNPLLGKVGARQSLDGWRDDQFPRKIEFRTSSLKTLEEFVVSGSAIAYLPDYFCRNTELQILAISGCPYTCIQKVKMVAKDPKEFGWLNRLF